MSALAPLKQQIAYRINLVEHIGYPLWLEVNAPSHSRPLFWHSENEEGDTENSHFLQAPGLHLKNLISHEELAKLPEEAVSLAFYLPEKHYQLLQAMLVSIPAMELATSCPLLFVLLVLNAEKQKLDATHFKSLVAKKRIDILKHLNLPATPSLVKILSRTSINTFKLYDLQTLHQVLKKPEFMKPLQHIKQPCLQHFVFIRRQNTSLTTNILNLITPTTTADLASEISKIIRDCFRLGMQKNQLRSITSLDGLDALHDRLIHRYNYERGVQLEPTYQAKYGTFPPPPFPGNEVVTPLTSWQDLAFEGQKMKHCVGSYHGAISQGKVFIYRAKASKRLTLSLISRDEQWVIDEVRGVANSNPCKEDLELIHQWYITVTGNNKINNQ